MVPTVTNRHNEVLLNIHRSLRLLQRRNKFVSVTPTNGLSPLELTILLELDAVPERGMVEFAELLHIDKSTASRSVKKIVAKKLIVLRPHPDDNRRSRLELTERGIQLLSSYDHNLNANYKLALSKVGAEARDHIIALMHQIADGLGEPKGVQRSGDIPYRVAQRRITRAFHLFSEEAFGTEMASLRFHILTVISELGRISIQGLCDLLGSLHSTVSYQVGQLEQNGLIGKVSAEADSRHRIVELSAAGHKLVASLEKQAVKQLVEATSGFPLARLSAAADALRSFVAGDSFSHGLYRVVPIESVHDKEEGRAFIVNRLVQLGQARTTPAHLISDDRYAFALYEKKDQLRGVAQFYRKGDKWELELCIVSGIEEVIPRDAFVAECLARLSDR